MVQRRCRASARACPSPDLAAMAMDRDAALTADEALAAVEAVQGPWSLRVMYLIADRLGLRAGLPPLPIQPLPKAVEEEGVSEVLQGISQIA